MYTRCPPVDDDDDDDGGGGDDIFCLFGWRDEPARQPASQPASLLAVFFTQKKIIIIMNSMKFSRLSVGTMAVWYQ